jgi:hypothetical protein
VLADDAPASNKEREKITKVLEEEDMLWKNVRRIKGC